MVMEMHNNPVDPIPAYSSMHPMVIPAFAAPDPDAAMTAARRRRRDLRRGDGTAGWLAPVDAPESVGARHPALRARDAAAARLNFCLAVAQAFGLPVTSAGFQASLCVLKKQA